MSSWTSFDKVLHFVGGAVLYLISGSMLLVLVAAAGKELIDEISYGGFDYKDLIATLLGGLFIYLLWNF